MALEIARSFPELMKTAATAEAEGDALLAARLYERAVRLAPHEERPYRRLMILYRKQHAYEKELAIIRKAIAVFEARFDERGSRLFGANSKAEQLSKQLASALGQRDRKGLTLAYPEPIPTWQRRAEGVEKKLEHVSSAKRKKPSTKREKGSKKGGWY